MLFWKAYFTKIRTERITLFFHEAKTAAYNNVKLNFYAFYCIRNKFSEMQVLVIIEIG